MPTRRDVLLAGCIVLLATHRLSHGQPLPKSPRIGILWFSSSSDPPNAKYGSAFRQRLSALGYITAIYDVQNLASEGGLIAYGPLLIEHYVMAAGYVDRILKGAKPADLPVEQPARFELVVNLKTAKALGLTIPQSLLVRADEVIQ